jgi:hypothetical protein
MALSPVESALTLYLIYYRLPAILSINSPTEQKKQVGDGTGDNADIVAFCREAG